MTKAVLVLYFMMPVIINAQLYKDWQHLDPEKDSILGIGTYRTIEYMKNKKSYPVVVAILDNGVELSHQDLKGQIWTNPGEIDGNGIDDDKNGYVDDIHGWNFLGNNEGQNIKRETTELTRLYGKLSKKFGNLENQNVSDTSLREYERYLEIKTAYQEELKKKKDEIRFYSFLLSGSLKSDQILTKHFSKDDYTTNDLKSIKDTAGYLAQAKNFMMPLLEAGYNISKLKGIIENNRQDLDTRLNPDYNIRREIIGDNPDDLNDKNYGNNMINAEGPSHGTGVAGIIGALYNDFGVNGVAINVKLMILRILPNGDEQDKDVALAIRYALNNHADIINCSFGKNWSSHPEFVEQAMKEAEKKGVLIVHAAGNFGQNNDSINTYPTGYYSNGKRAANWINVGASQMKDNESMIASFSNYGKNSVDVFAPGQDMYICTLGSKYEQGSGTSLAAPVVSGIAAVLKSYFPKLRAARIKDIIVRSAYIPRTSDVIIDAEKNGTIRLKDISVSGGIANLYRAILMAEKEGK